MSGAEAGTVYLVGAGPGDPDLVTARARELVRAADVLLVDRLAPGELAHEASADAEVVDVGKVAGRHALPQEEINELLVTAARAGRVVVRLKGGDPYVFGRGGEEAQHCRAAGIPFEVVPGVTSAFAACADAGIPVTHRDISRHVTVVTASAGRDGRGDPDYEWLAASDGTVVLLMGLRRVLHVCEQLVAAGRDPSTPAAVISRGTTPQQRTVVATLGTLAREVERAGLASPAIIVVGEVVRLREQLDWFEQRPLFGTSIAVTRARAQASSLVARLRGLGARVVEAPAIRAEALPTDELDAVLAELDAFGTLVFTSRVGVDHFFARLTELGRDARALAAARVAVVGTATADACRAWGVIPDVVPPIGQRTGAGLVAALGELPIFGTRSAVIRAEEGDDSLLEGLTSLGCEPTLARVYRTVVETPAPQLVEALLACDLITFTSKSTVRNVRAFVPAPAALPPAVTIGPITTAAATWAGCVVQAEAADPSIDALVDAVVEAAASSGATRPSWQPR